MKAALSAMMVKTDRKDARGLAPEGWFRPVHAKSMGSQEVRALLVARKQLLAAFEHSWNPARLWSEGRRCDAQGL